MTTDTIAPARRRRGSYAKTEATRQAILDAALEVFSQSGYRAGSLRDIAARVEMSEAGLLHHFRNKSALLAAVLEHRDDRARTFVPLSADDGARVIRGIVRLVDYNTTIPGVVELYTTLSAEATSPGHPAHEYFIGRYVYVRGMLERAFELLGAEGRLRHGITPRRAAVTMTALMDGLQVQWLLDRDSVDMADELRVLFSTFIDIEWDAVDDEGADPDADSADAPDDTPDADAGATG